MLEAPSLAPAVPSVMYLHAHQHALMRPSSVETPGVRNLLLHHFHVSWYLNRIGNRAHVPCTAVCLHMVKEECAHLFCSIRAICSPGFPSTGCSTLSMRARPLRYSYSCSAECNSSLQEQARHSCHFTSSLITPMQAHLTHLMQHTRRPLSQVCCGAAHKAPSLGSHHVQLLSPYLCPASWKVRGQ